MKMEKYEAGALFTLFSMTLLVACESDEYTYEGDPYVEEELSDEEAALEDEYAYEGQTGGESPDEDIYELEPHDMDLTMDSDPQAANGPMLGGQGGTYYATQCPATYVAIGLSVLPTSNGQMVRHVGLICGPRSRVENGDRVPSSEQWVISTGFRSDVWPHPIHPPREFPRSSYESQMAFESNSFFYCDDGFAMRGFGARTGTLVDRIENLSCKRIDGSGGLLLYSEPVGVGGWGGTSNTSYCTSWHETINGLRFRSAWQLDAVGSICSI